MEPGKELQTKIESIAGGRIRPGDELLLLGLAGSGCVRRLCAAHRPALEERFSSSYIQRIEAEEPEEKIHIRECVPETSPEKMVGQKPGGGPEEKVSSPEAVRYESAGSPEQLRSYNLEKEDGKSLTFQARAVLPLDMEGGILAGLWILSQASHTGLGVDLRLIPIKQETIELCEILGLNPYTLPSEGVWLLAVENGFELAQTLKKEGLRCTRIGTAQKGKKKLLYNGDEIRYLERPAAFHFMKPCPAKR